MGRKKSEIVPDREVCQRERRKRFCSRAEMERVSAILAVDNPATYERISEATIERIERGVAVDLRSLRIYARLIGFNDQYWLCLHPEIRAGYKTINLGDDLSQGQEANSLYCKEDVLTCSLDRALREQILCTLLDKRKAVFNEAINAYLSQLKTLSIRSDNDYDMPPSWVESILSGHDDFAYLEKRLPIRGQSVTLSVSPDHVMALATAIRLESLGPQARPENPVHRFQVKPIIHGAFSLGQIRELAKERCQADFAAFGASFFTNIGNLHDNSLTDREQQVLRKYQLLAPLHLTTRHVLVKRGNPVNRIVIMRGGSEEIIKRQLDTSKKIPTRYTNLARIFNIDGSTIEPDEAILAPEPYASWATDTHGMIKSESHTTRHLGAIFVSREFCDLSRWNHPNLPIVKAFTAAFVHEYLWASKSVPQTIAMLKDHPISFTSYKDLFTAY